MVIIKSKLLTDKIFLLGLGVLLINDLILKYAFSGFITGKLSDISGLFIFPFFWSIFFEQYKKGIYLFTVLLFAFWKLPISTSFLEFINYSLRTELQRTIDYTDLFTLVIVPVSYKYFTIQSIKTAGRELKWSAHGIIICTLSLFSFIATTLPMYQIDKNVSINEKFTLNLPIDKVFSDLIPTNQFENDTTKSLPDSLFYLLYYSDIGGIKARVKIYEIGPTQTALEFTSVEGHIIYGRLFGGQPKREPERIKKLTKYNYLEGFKTEVINKINPNDTIRNQIYYWK